MVLAAAHFGFWGVQGISNTPKIIFPRGKYHKIVFNLALSCSDFPNLSYFPFFSNIPFISLQRTLFWEAFGFDRFFICFQYMGELDGSGSFPHWFLRNAGHLQDPLNNFLKNEFGFELQVLMRSRCNLIFGGILTWLPGSTHETWCWIYLRCRIRNASILKNKKPKT